MNVNLGYEIDNPNKELQIDINTLIDTRLLIQANSGGGKSYIIRKLLEETHGKVQQIVLDLEGEFSTLREKHDYLLIGKEGDLNIDVKTAPLLARKLLELNASAIIDLYELKKHERIRFVKLFLDSMMNVPKKLWHPCLVIVDEAHVLCPEKGQSEASSSVIDLQTRGRKRKFCGVLATQRISKLNKDAAAECNNKFIGRTGLDIDMKRVAEELGFTTKEQQRSLRNLEAGEFYAFGPAISRSVVKVKIGEVKTTHGHIGTNIKSLPLLAPFKIKKFLDQLKDLPKEAEEELKTTNDLKKKIKELQWELRRKPVVIKIDEAAVVSAEIKGFRNAEKQYKDSLHNAELELKRTKHGIDVIAKTISQYSSVKVDVEIPKIKTLPLSPRKARHFETKIDTYNENEEINLGRCPQAILDALGKFYPKPLTKSRISLVTGYSIKSSGFNNGLSTLNTQGLIRRIDGKMFEITNEGQEQAQDVDLLPSSPEEVHQFWLNKLPRACSKILKELIEVYPAGLSKEEIAERTEYSIRSSGFNNSLSKLNTLTLINRGAEITASEELF